jgi:hypothetical protein
MGNRNPALLVLLGSRDVLGGLPVLRPKFPDQPEEDPFAEKKPKSRQHEDQGEEGINLPRIGRRGRYKTFDHINRPLENEEEDNGYEGADASHAHVKD